MKKFLSVLRSSIHRGDNCIVIDIGGITIIFYRNHKGGFR